MGNRGCSCTPQEQSKGTPPRAGHVLRVWAEVFHVSAASGAVRWTQVSDDIVPVTVTCIAADATTSVFRVVAHNARADRVLDVRVPVPGTRMGQASDCFVYWKDSLLGDTWGLNFTAPADARAFRECLTRRSIPSQQQQQHHHQQQQQQQQQQCTCMTAEALHRARNGRVRYTPQAMPRVQRQRSAETAPRVQPQKQPPRARSSDDVRTVGTTTDDLDAAQLKKLISGVECDDRSKRNRSTEGRRRSLERTQCVDVSDPPSQTHEWDQFEAILTQSMSDVATLMRQVELELDEIRHEERLLRASSSSLPTTLRSDWFDYCVTSSEFSDTDERMSLTNVSDDEMTDARASVSGATRKAGFLNVKKWLLRKRHSLELARKRAWKGYWVCLKGTTLLFFDAHARDTQHRHVIFVDASLVQTVPEHPKRENVLCLSTAFGDAYLIQASSASDADQWSSAIHSACAASFARARGRSGCLHVLQEEIHRLEIQWESDLRRKHETELRMTLTETPSPLRVHIQTLEDSLERIRLDQFRMRCYASALSASESPNPKTLLTHVSRRTKASLNRLGVFTVSSLHAFVAARDRHAHQRQSPRPQQPIVTGTEHTLHLTLPNGDVTTVTCNPNDTISDVMGVACRGTRFLPNEHALHARFRDDDAETVVTETAAAILPAVELHVRPKGVFTCDMQRQSTETLFGFSVEAELNDDRLLVHVSRVEDDSFAARTGLLRGDEIVVINGSIVADLDMLFVESLLTEELSLSMMVRTSRCSVTTETDDLIASLMCPPPPPINGLELTDAELNEMIVPAPDVSAENEKLKKVIRELSDTERVYCDSLETLLSHFLEPLRSQIPDAETLFQHVTEIARGARAFRDALSDCGDDAESVSRAFLTHLNTFRSYAAFCACHARASRSLREAIHAPHELDAHLIRPIQRVLKYPLLLQQMRSLVRSERVAEAARAMESVAEHINDSMRVHDEYGAIFEHLQRQSLRTTKTAIDLSASQLEHYGGVQWLNSAEFLGKGKKELHSMVFVFSSAVVFLCKERHKKKGETVEVIRHQTLIPVNEVQVKSIRNESNWQLIHLRTASTIGGRRHEKTYDFANSSGELRNLFLKHIRSIIRESVAKMTLKESAKTVSCAACGDSVSVGVRDSSPIWKRRTDSVGSR